MVIDYVKVCDSSYTAAQCTAAQTDGSDAHVIFYDDFNGSGTSPAAPIGLIAIVK